MFTTNKAHDLAFVKGPDAKLHHAGFVVDSLHDVFKAADLLSMYEVPFDVTPTRHGITRGKRFISLTHQETGMRHLQVAIWPTQICQRSHGQRTKSDKVFSITVENYLNPL